MNPKRKSVARSSLAECVAAATQWFRLRSGKALLQREQADIDEALGCLFGYHLCQISVCQGLELTGSSRISHTFALNPCADSRLHESDVGCCDFHRLPLAPESVDVFLLHHALDYSQTPHQLLAEAVRATIARGHLVILGFNPWSIGGVWRLIKRIVSRKPLWQQQHLRLARLYDWFALLDLEVVDVKRGHFWPVVRDEVQSTSASKFERFMRRIKAPWGDYYMVTVRKDVLGAIPLKPPWQAEKPVRLVSVSGKLSGREASRDSNQKL